MALGVVLLDVSELCRAAESLVVPVEVAQPPVKHVSIGNLCGLWGVLLVKVWVSAADVTDVALEVLHVDGIEANDCGEETDVLLCEAVAEVERTAGLGEVFFGTIQRLEKLGDGLLVGFLGAV